MAATDASHDIRRSSVTSDVFLQEVDCALSPMAQRLVVALPRR